MNARGSVFKYPDNVDTDVIIPARHLNTQDPKELASHCMEDIDKDFVNRVQPGDIMVGGWNFGCGSSREHAPLCIKTAGIAVVIAKSFARIFYRNSINIGLPIMECPEAVDAIEAGEGNPEISPLSLTSFGSSPEGAPYSNAANFPTTAKSRPLGEGGTA